MNNKILYNQLYERTKDFGRTQFIKELMRLERENNQLKEELRKSDSLTQSCIFEGKEESELNFRKAINIIKDLRSWLEEEKSTYGSYRYDEVLNKLNELEGREDEH